MRSLPACRVTSVPAKPKSRPRDTGKPTRRKSCAFCRDRVREVDYKNVGQLRRFVSERGKIRSPRMTGACRKHQRQLAVAIKRAREMALLPYVADAGPPSKQRQTDRR
jgi:small subunit ribosomal protein S18